ncbi:MULTISPECIES: cupin domain-containing protein [Phyllobacteriaceae]|nr:MULTISPECIES: cupin domain-containing protein [Phyllobacteriaceae]
MLILPIPLQAEEVKKGKDVIITPILETDRTTSGQIISLPQGNVQVIVSKYEIAPGAELPIHKHSYPRYGYVLAGMLRVSNQDTGKSRVFKTGEFIVEAIDQWHQGTNIGSTPLELLVIDQVEEGKSNIILPDKAPSGVAN